MTNSKAEIGHILHESPKAQIEKPVDDPTTWSNLDDDNADGKPIDENEAAFWNRDELNKTAHYNYASEKSLSHVDAKLFYQGHKIESPQQDMEPLTLARSRTVPSNFNDGMGILSRTASRPSDHGGLPPERSVKSLTSMENANPDELESNRLNDFNDYRSHLGQEILEDKIDNLDMSNGNQSSGTHAEIENVGISSSNIAPEMREICDSIKRVLDIRHKYIEISLQRPNDNPKDQAGWRIYPPPPEPVWDDVKNRPCDQNSNSNSLANSRVLPPDQGQKKSRKPGHDIGEDLDLSDFSPLPEEAGDVTFRLDKGSVYQVYENVRSIESGSPLICVPTLRDFYKDLEYVKDVSSDGPCKSFAFRELEILEGKFNLYFLVNEYEETATCKRVPHRDFYNVRKVDTHVHHSACMNQKHLLRFIKSKMKKSPNETVLFRDGKHLTLAEVFESIHLTAYDLSIDTLDMHAHTDSFHRFDKFNLKYNPVGESRLREIFLKSDNFIKGSYLAELTKEVIADLESSKYQMVEWRISIYGRTLDEWDKLAAWIVDNKVISHNVRWLIQIPRLYHVYKREGRMNTFEQLIINVFQPLFEVTENPSSHLKLHIFLQRVVGFDSVDDESKMEPRLHKKFPSANEWDTSQNPPYTYWIYYLFANMTSLNLWRKRRGFNTFVLRPHCGEAGDLEHLAVAAICCHSISHGLLLRKAPLLQYIFYLEQIGIAMSPLSNNALFLTYERNPFPKYFRRGLNVSLSTDDPLQIAFTKEPLIEEYSVAAQIYKLSAVDMCELAQHSVMQSGFEHQIKQRWLGPNYDLPGVQGNNVAKSNVPDIREKFRLELLLEQLAMIDRYTTPAPAPANPTSPQVPPSPSSLMRINTIKPTSPLLAARLARFAGSRSSTDLKTTTIHAQYPHPGDNNNRIPRERSYSSTTMTMLPVAAMRPRSTTWRTAGGIGVGDELDPRIFPGIVHERARRSSIRRGSDSENEPDSSLAGSLTGSLRGAGAGGGGGGYGGGGGSGGGRKGWQMEDIEDE